MEVGIAHDFIGKMKKTHFAFIAFVPNWEFVHFFLNILLDWLWILKFEDWGRKTNASALVLMLQLLNQIADSLQLLLA